jgi:hypothetical protein
MSLNDRIHDALDTLGDWADSIKSALGHAKGLSKARIVMLAMKMAKGEPHPAFEDPTWTTRTGGQNASVKDGKVVIRLSLSEEAYTASPSKAASLGMAIMFAALHAEKEARDEP